VVGVGLKVKSYQQKISEVFDRITEKYNFPKSAEFAFYKLAEEFGEVNKEFRKFKFKPGRKQKERLHYELMDLFCVLLWFAQKVGLNFEKFVVKYKRKLKTKFNVDF
jgi:NTP pyrophosphatase (non-canonical NTP hydrolase)